MSLPRLTRHGEPPPRVVTDLAIAALRDLGEHSLLVMLAPAPRPEHEQHMVRVVCDRNPGWYSRFVARRMDVHKGRRKPRPGGASRARVVRALRRMGCGFADPRGLEHELLAALWPLRSQFGVEVAPPRFRVTGRSFRASAD